MHINQDFSIDYVVAVSGNEQRRYGYRITPEFHLSGGVGWTNARYTSYPAAPIGNPHGGTPSVIGDVSGNYLPLAAKYTVNGAATYTVPLASGEVAASANIVYNSGYHLESDNMIRQPAFAQIGASLTWRNDQYSLGVFGKNLTARKTLAFSTTLPEGVHGFLWTPPRVYGVTAGVNF